MNFITFLTVFAPSGHAEKVSQAILFTIKMGGEDKGNLELL